MNFKSKVLCVAATGAFVCIWLASGCKKSEETDAQGNDALAEEVSALKRSVQLMALAVANNEMTAREIEYLKERLDQITQQNAAANVVTFTPSNEGYTVIRTELGELTADLRKISPYANGVRILLRFGNLQSGNLNGVNFQISYGEVDERGQPKPSTVKGKQVEVAKPLKSGSFTDVSIVLENISPKSLGFVTVGNVKSSGVGLFDP